MKPPLKILAATVVLLAGLLFIKITPTEMQYGYFACDCAPEGFCSKIFTIEDHKIKIDNINFCKMRNVGGLFTCKPQVIINWLGTKEIDDCKMEVPLIMFLDPRSVFGCPDCTDAGGIYLEFSKWGIKRHFELDEAPFYFAQLKSSVERKINLVNSIKSAKNKD